MNRRTQKPMSGKQLKSMWNQQMERPKPKVRVFNQYVSNMKGKIKIDNNTYINYDYSGDYPKTSVQVKDQNNHIDRDKFEMPCYPKLKNVITEIPKNTKNLKEMDLFLMKDLDEALLWKGKEFEFHS